MRNDLSTGITEQFATGMLNRTMCGTTGNQVKAMITILWEINLASHTAENTCRVDKNVIPQMKGLESCETTELHLIKKHKG